MVKTRKCKYQHCKEGGIVNVDDGVKDGEFYYHFQCYEKKYMKQKIFQAFCDYVTNEEHGFFIKKKISDYIDKEDISPYYVYFTMYYIIKNKIPLKSIFGLGIVMKQQRVVNAYNKLIDEYKNVKIQPENIDYIYKKEFKGGWRDLIG